MKNKILFFSCLLIIFFLSIGVIFYAKNKIRHIDYTNYIETALYSSIDNNEYRNMFEFGNLKTYKEVKTLDELENISDYILIVSNLQPPRFLGNGIINNLFVKKVIKGDNISVNSTINVYDLLVSWNDYSAIYLGGSTPLNIGEDYIVFLNKTTNASLNNTFVFANDKFSHFSLSRDIEVLNATNQSTNLNINQASNYDHIFFDIDNTTEIDAYKEFAKQIIEYYI